MPGYTTWKSLVFNHRGGCVLSQVRDACVSWVFAFRLVAMAHLGPFEVGQIKAHLYDGLTGPQILGILKKPDGKTGWSKQFANTFGVASRTCGQTSLVPETRWFQMGVANSDMTDKTTRTPIHWWRFIQSRNVCTSPARWLSWNHTSDFAKRLVWA